MMVVEVDVWAGVVKPRRRRDKPRAPKAEELTSILQNCVQKTMTTGTVVGIGWWHSFFDLVVVAAYTGARRAGLIDMRAADVDLEGRRLALREKGGKERTVVLAGAALHAMDRQMTRRDVAGWSQIPSARGESPHVWLTQTGRAFSPKTISEYWDRVRGDFPFGIHSLRHFAATWLAERGVDELDIAVQLGHVDQQGRPYRELVDRIYNHPDPEAALRRVQAAIEGGA